eukprot:scaffold907_cov318-Pavlova_lutheri.AAC.9
MKPTDVGQERGPWMNRIAPVSSRRAFLQSLRNPEGVQNIGGTHVRTGFHAYVALQYEESPNNSKMATLPRVARYFVTYWALSFVAFCMLLEKALPQTKHGNF